MHAHPHDHHQLQTRGRRAAALLLAAASSASLHAQLSRPVAAMPHIAIRYEIAASAIATALTAEGLAIPPDRLHLAMPVSASTPAPQLRIAAAELRQDATLQLRILCRNAGECMPFFATVAMPDRESALAAIASLHGATPTPKPDQPAATRAPVIAPGSAPGSAHVSAAGNSPVISPGTRVTLELNDTQMHIHLPAVAIDTGAPGTEVRVASLDRKHTWRATVIDAETVRGGLQ